jgi:hypothetical protein
MKNRMWSWVLAVKRCSMKSLSSSDAALESSAPLVPLPPRFWRRY